MSTFKLPDIDPAPVSDLQMLLRKLLEDRDLTVVQPLLDELEGLGRTEDVVFVKQSLSPMLRKLLVSGIPTIIQGMVFDVGRTGSASPITPSQEFIVVIRDLLERFWFDLFDTGASLRALQKSLDAQPKAPESVGTGRDLGPLIYGNAADAQRALQLQEEMRNFRNGLGATRERTPEEHQRWLQEQVSRFTLQSEGYDRPPEVR